MPVTQQDLLEWTKEYKTLRKLNPSLKNFNDWLKDRILWNEQHTNNHQHNNNNQTQEEAGLNISPNRHVSSSLHSPGHAHVITSIGSPASAQTPPRRRSPRNTQGPTRNTQGPTRNTQGLTRSTQGPTHEVSYSIPQHSPSSSSPHHPFSSPQGPSSPSPPLVTPERQLHVQPHSHHSTPILHPVLSTLRSPSPPSSSPSSPNLSSRKSSSPEHSSPALLVPQHTQYLPRKETKTKAIKRRFVSPPRNALFRSLSQSLIFPHGQPPQQMTHIATYDYPLDLQAPHGGDVAELKNYITQFQSKQQNQLFQIFDIVERINGRLSTGPVALSSSLSPSSHPTRSSPPRKPSTKQRNARPLVAKKDLSPFTAIFSDQISSIRKILQDEYNRTAEDTSYTKKLYQMTKLRKIHQVSVEFLLSLAQKLQVQAQFLPNSEKSDLGLDLGMIISQLAGLNADMQMKFPFLFGGERANGNVANHKRKTDPFTAKLAKHTQTSKSSDNASRESQTTAVKNEAGSQTKNKESHKRVQTDSSLNNASFDMAEVNDSIQKISTDTELLKTEFDELKSVAQASTQAVLKKYDDIHRESKTLDKEANKELKELKSIFTQFLGKFEQVHKDQDERDDLEKEIERESRERRERLDAEEKERKARLESERREREERYLRDREEKDRKERREREERERLEREAREKRDREYRERKDREEREDRERREREERYKRELEETERLEKEERERAEQERRLKEENEWNLRIEQERHARMERERRIQEERERKEYEERERERETRERLAKEWEREHYLREQREREERERVERERMLMEQREMERLEREKEERDKVERERLAMIERANAAKRDARDRERLEMEILERQRMEKESGELSRFKRENARNWDLLMTTLHDMEKDEDSLRHSTHSLLRSTQTTPVTRHSPPPHQVRRLQKPNRGITDRLIDDICYHNAKEMDGMCGDYLEDLVRLQVDEVLHSPDIDIADLL